MSSYFFLQTDGEINLKLPALEDADELFALVDFNRKFLRQYLPWVDSTVSVADTKGFIAGCREKLDAGRGFDLCVIYKGRIIGMIDLHYIDKENAKTEIGYWIGEDLQGKGIIRRSCHSLITYVFDTLKLHRIEIRCALKNSASQRVPETLGFTKEGVLRACEQINGKFVDNILYSLLSTDKRPIIGEASFSS